MTYPKHLGELSIEQDVAIIKTWLDIEAMAVSDPLVTWDIEPITDCAYDIGNVDKRFRDLWLCRALVLGEPDDYGDPATYLWYTKGAGYTQLYMRVQEDTSGYGDLYIRVNGTSGDFSALSLESEGGGNSAEFTAKVGAGRGSGYPQYEFYESSAYITANVQVTGGMMLTTPSLSAFIDEAALGFYWRDSDPNKPVTNGEAAIWLSDGTATGAAGDLMCEIMAGYSTRTFTLASHAGGAGSMVTDQYLSHNGDLDTRINFTDDKIAFEAGGVTFLELIEAADDIIHFNSANADVDFQIDTAGGDGALFVEGSSGLVGLGLTSGLSGLLHVNQSGAAAAIPVLHLEQDDISEEFLRLTGQAASAVLTQSLVDVGDVASFSPVGYLKINVQDEGDQITDGPYYVEFGTLS